LKSTFVSSSQNTPTLPGPLPVTKALFALSISSWLYLIASSLPKILSHNQDFSMACQNFSHSHHIPNELVNASIIHG